MNGIVTELMRWQKHTPLRRDANQWTEWVRFLIERYSSIHLRYGRPTMIHLQRGGPIYRISQRWEYNAWKYYPKIELAIGLILQTIGNYSVGNKEAEVKKQSHNKPVAYNRSDFSPAKLSYLFDMSHKKEDRTETDYLAGEKTQALSIPENTPPSALNQVFARVNKRNKLNLFSETLIQGESNRILRRLVHRSRRIEEDIYGKLIDSVLMTSKPTRPDMVPDMIVVREQKDFSLVRTEGAEMELPDRTRGNAGVGAQVTSQPQINVEQLTEHVIRRIDHRIRAHRERRGKAF